MEPFCGHLSPNIDKVSEELTLRYPHEEPCADGDVFADDNRYSPQRLKTSVCPQAIRARMGSGSIEAHQYGETVLVPVSHLTDLYPEARRST